MSSAAVVIGALRVNPLSAKNQMTKFLTEKFQNMFPLSYKSDINQIFKD